MSILLTLLTFAPFVVILLPANVADRRREQGAADGGIYAPISYGLLILIYANLMLGGLLLSLISVLGATGSTASLAAAGPALWIPSLLGIVVLLPAVRRLVARFIPIDPRSSVHAVALSYIMLAAMNLLLTMSIGLSTIADMLQKSGTSGTSLSSTASDLWVQAIAFIVLAVIGVGWLTRRTLGQALQRLGISRPSLRQAALALGTGLIMAVLGIGAGMLIDALGLGSHEVDRLSDLLVGPLTRSALGVLSLGLAAGIGEETLFRGALQPRFGLILTTTVFALLHSQYGFSFSTVIVFIVGLILGLIRRRTNTTTSMICHATYNIGLVVLSSL